MRLFSFICMAVFICVEAVIAFLYSKRQERPLDILTKNLERGIFVQEDSDLNIKEFSLIRDMFKRQLEEKKQLYEMVKNTKNDSKKFLLRRLIEGVDIEQIEKEDILRKCDISFTTNWFAVGIIRIENHTDKEDLDIFIVKNVFEELFNCGYTGYMIHPEKFIYVFILNLKKKEDADNISNTLDEGKQFLENVFKLQTTIACSNVCEGLAQISRAYEHAKQAMEYRYLYGKGSKIFYQDICERDNMYHENKKLLPLMQTFVMGERQEDYTAKDCVTDLLLLNKINQEVSMKRAENFELQAMQALHAVMAEIDCAALKKKEYISELINRETLEEFVRYLAEVLKNLKQNRSEQGDEKDICVHARTYIKEHLDHAELSVGDVADAVGMSASYLSKIYKSKFEVSIAQDISNFRIEKAKELLRETTLNINVIAEKTGFSTNIVFARAFKKAEGITPGEYRKRES